MGALGFALPGGDRRCAWRCRDRPVVAVVGDGSSMYAIQALWSAAHYGVGALFVVLANGGYAIMDRLAARTAAPRPVAARSTASTSPAMAARARLPGGAASRTTPSSSGARRRRSPALAGRREPLLVEVAVAR